MVRNLIQIYSCFHCERKNKTVNIFDWSYDFINFCSSGRAFHVFKEIQTISEYLNLYLVCWFIATEIPTFFLVSTCLNGQLLSYVNNVRGNKLSRESREKGDQISSHHLAWGCGQRKILRYPRGFKPFVLSKTESTLHRGIFPYNLPPMPPDLCLARLPLWPPSPTGNSPERRRLWISQRGQSVWTKLISL